jgi:O-antigen/teichoic acid export membrane protein
MTALLQNRFLRTLLLLVTLNLLVKPVWIFAIDRQVQNLTGFAAYGSYYAMLSFCFLFTMVLDPGLHIRLSRDSASNPERRQALFSEAFLIKLFLTLSFWVLLLPAAYATGVTDWGTLLPVATFFSCASFFTMLRHFMSGAQLFRQDAWLSIIDKTLVILSVGALILFPQSGLPVTIGLFVWVQVAALLVAIVVGIRTIVRHIGPLHFGLFGHIDLAAFGSGLPYAVNTFLMGMVSWPDGFLLERLHPSGAEEAGLYAAGYRLLDAFGMLGSIVGGSLLPYITGLSSVRGDFQSAFSASRKVLMLAAVLVATCMATCPSYFSELLYHRTEGPLVAVMSTLMPALPALYIVHMQGTLLTATGHIGTFIKTSLGAALASLLLKLFLLPTFGAQASAWICLGVYWSYAAALLYCTHRRLSNGLGWIEALLYAMTALGCYGMLRILIHLRWDVGIAVLSATATSALVFATVGGVRFRDIRHLLKGK